MQMTQESLKKVAEKGSLAVAADLEKLCTYQVKADVEQIDRVNFIALAEQLKNNLDKAVVTYAKLFTGPEGAAILLMSREDSLILVDLLNGHEVGTTGVLKDMDRSAIKETLNILSNSYVEAMADEYNIKVMVGPPHMVTLDRLLSILPKMENEQEESVLFKTNISVAKQKINASLLFLFDKKFTEELQHLV